MLKNRQLLEALVARVTVVDGVRSNAPLTLEDKRALLWVATRLDVIEKTFDVAADTPTYQIHCQE